MTDQVIDYPETDRPNVFAQAHIGWRPWLEPLTSEALTKRHWEGLADAARANSPYFMLLVRDPDILLARTNADKDIFYNTAPGLPRAERELAATPASRFNGCVFCASVHARFASQDSTRRDEVQRLLDEGVGADIGERWNAIVEAAVALSTTPVSFGSAHIARLSQAGLDDVEVSAPAPRWAGLGEGGGHARAPGCGLTDPNFVAPSGM